MKTIDIPYQTSSILYQQLIIMGELKKPLQCGFQKNKAVQLKRLPKNGCPAFSPALSIIYIKLKPFF